jgi:hypothetical protein
MLAAHTASFLKLINTQFDEISRGLTSPHHLHNVRCGIENILSLLEYDNDIVAKADQLAWAQQADTGPSPRWHEGLLCCS